MDSYFQAIFQTNAHCAEFVLRSDSEAGCYNNSLSQLVNAASLTP